MPFLGDYLGQLLSEIAMARMQADLETIRLAELYASHPLLRTLPVPHVRLPSVDLDVPVLVKESQEPRRGESVRGGLPLANASAKVEEVVSAHLTKEGVTLSTAERKRLKDALAQPQAPGGPQEVAVDVHRIADEAAATTYRTLRELRPGRAPSDPAGDPQREAGLVSALRAELLKLRTPPPRLNVLVTSAELREAGTAENVTRLRLKVSEEGLEWATIESDGIQRDRLVPE